MKIYLFPILPVFILACASGPKPAERKLRPEQLHGQWRNVYMRLDMKTHKNSDSSWVLEVNEENWADVMKIQPIRTYFWYDGTYNSLHYDLNDSLFYNPAGRWKLENDTLIMNDTFPQKGLQYKYKISIHGDVAEFRGIEDLDGDGEADDLYYGTQRKFEMNPM